MWASGSIYNGRVESLFREKDAIAGILEDADIAAVPELVQVLKNPDAGMNPLIVDMLLHPHDGPYWKKRRVRYDDIKVPGYIGACWGIYGLHLPGTFRSWENLKGLKKMLIGPPAYLDRPLYQLKYLSLRWFDYWLKGIDTGIMEEPPIKLFVMGTSEWKEANDWPLPETKWTPFYLHEDGIMYECECWPDEGFDSFKDSPWGRGCLEYCSPRLVENTEIIGPILLNLYASTSDTEVFWFISLREVDSEGNERILIRGWLRGTHRETDPNRSKPWEPFHPHSNSEPLIPDKIYEFNIPVVPTGNLFKAGFRIKLKIACSDDQPRNPFEMLAGGHLMRQSASRITVFHNANYPSHLLLPITRGNVLETFVSGGKPFF
jgi:hypothetical protein